MYIYMDMPPYLPTIYLLFNIHWEICEYDEVEIGPRDINQVGPHYVERCESLR